MFRKIIFNTSMLAILLSVLSGANAQTPIGSWKDYLSYQAAIAVDSGPELIWTATPYAVYSFNPVDNALERFSKISGLSESFIASIGAHPAKNQLIIAYTTGNIDILEDLKVRNIDALKRSSIPDDKTVYSIFMTSSLAYLSTGFGIVILDTDRGEIRETAYIGENGNALKINQLIILKDTLYAATATGLKAAPAQGVNLQDFRNWNNLPAGLPDAEVMGLADLNGQLFLQIGNTIYKKSGSDFEICYNSPGIITAISASAGSLVITEQSTPSARVMRLTSDGVIDQLFSGTNIQRPFEAIQHGQDLWIADSIAGLLRINGNVAEQVIPSSPYSISAGQLIVDKGRVWTAAANPFYPGTGPQNGLYHFSSGIWKNYLHDLSRLNDSLPMIHTLSPDPRDGTIWAGSYGGGLVHIDQQGSVEIIKDPRILSPDRAVPSGFFVGGIVFDSNNDLWITNSGSDEMLSVLRKDGSAQKFILPFSYSGQAGKIIIDDEDQKWIIAPGGNGVMVMNHGISVDDPGDDQWKWLRSGQGNGNLPHNDVLSVAKDNNGFIWIGTGAGIGIIQCPQMIFSPSGCEAILPVVQYDNFAGYLFSGEKVQAIAVDAANRKWIGTTNGVWLISEDGEKIIHHFTIENSPLVSNIIYDITIDHSSGEVFFSTSAGICSFAGSALRTPIDNYKVFVYPNPVAPGYSGPIAIRGLPENAEVKITEMNGRLVYQGRALGGQAIWDGRSRDGRKISTGVYLVLVSGAGKKETISGKIIFINR